jgi:hypothetical protein
MPTASPTRLPNPRAAAEWLAVMRATDAIQLAGLRRRIGKAGDLQAAFRRSYEAHMREHDRALMGMLKSAGGDLEESEDGR